MVSTDHYARCRQVLASRRVRRPTSVLNITRLLVLFIGIIVFGNAMAQPAVEIASGTLDSERRDNVPSIVRLDVEPQATGINTITVAWDSDADLRFNVFDVANGRVTETTVRVPAPRFGAVF